MQRFARLFAQLDQTNKTSEKIRALSEYFRDVDPASAAWALYFLSGHKLQRVVPSGLLRQWAIEVADIQQWLFDECYEAVGDLAETISLIVPRSEGRPVDGTLVQWVEQRLMPLRQLTVSEQRQRILTSWQTLDQVACLVFVKLLTGSFRVGVSQKLVVRGIANASGIDAEVLAHRLMGNWQPSAAFYQALVHPDAGDAMLSRPYPFFLANPLEGTPSDLGDVSLWQAEWKWDGIRAQLIRRGAQTFIWSRGEELMQDRFPELESLAQYLPDGTILDGEIIGRRDGIILPFAHMQRRIGSKQLTRKILQEVPVAYLVFDLLEWQGNDLRAEPLSTRRSQLEQVMAELSRTRAAIQPDHEKQWQLSEHDLSDTQDRAQGRAGGTSATMHFLLPDTLKAGSWEELIALRSRSRDEHAEGLMLKRLNSPYRVGRPRGDWWKWKIEPYTVDAVLIYAQRGHGKRASLYTDYTFGVWDGDVLVPFAKAYSGLTDQEIAQVDRFIRQHTLERFGPVRSVQPELVFELAFENIQLSSRHKSGIAVRFPRILRQREDKPISQADSLATIRAMLGAASS
ncbi:MAG: ATP-dependent DNA ligase [Pirellulaceae bacterium]|nr:ATP-dependent DNA ligase [Pirellulaceae bacterium]